jgi:hypothetical protein
MPKNTDLFGRPCDRPSHVTLPHRGLAGSGAGGSALVLALCPTWALTAGGCTGSRRSGAYVHDTLGHGKPQGIPCVFHRRPLRPSRFAWIRRRRSATAWRDTPNSRATAAWPASSTSSAHSRRVACSSASSRPMRPSSECRCRFSVVVRSLRGRGTHSAYPLGRSTKGNLDGTLHLLGPERLPGATPCRAPVWTRLNRVQLQNPVGLAWAPISASGSP